MAETRKIKRALVSVYHKDGLEDILRALHQEGVELLSTGGTQSFIESLGIPCKKVEDVTTYPSILGGRVKTLHPKVFGGILARRDLESDVKDMNDHGIALLYMTEIADHNTVVLQTLYLAGERGRIHIQAKPGRLNRVNQRESTGTVVQFERQQTGVGTAESKQTASIDDRVTKKLACLLHALAL